LRPSETRALRRRDLSLVWRDGAVTRLAENPAVSEETIRQLAGHASPRMLARYAHIRAQARRDAIATLEGPEATTRKDSHNQEIATPER
jgi:hypothetical protein